jgi:7,8-dihydropterin-6-yl-methyl-4-(beta-D-ribofuranosyl)aminobenzene 5'-phosphate synthase
VGNRCDCIPERFEDTDNCFFLDAHRTNPDLIDDELAVWIETRRGIILLTGCCHVGIVNTIEHVQRLTGKQICAVIGGLHLLHATKQQLDADIKTLNKLPQLEQIMLCHCTGETVTARSYMPQRAKGVRRSNQKARGSSRRLSTGADTEH